MQRYTDDYFIGTSDDEVERLFRQHVVWCSRMTDAWRRAGFSGGHHLVDVGCGPGHATLDLAAVAGRTGRVTAIDRSERFLTALERWLPMLDVHNVTPIVADLDSSSLPELAVDGAWCRWVLCFLHHPRELLKQLSERLRPGGRLVVHEYFDYGTWRMTPACGALDEYVNAVIRSWRAEGGEPDIALDLLGWLPGCGFEVREVSPLVSVVKPGDPMWEWPDSFVHAGARRLAALGALSPVRAEQLVSEYRAAVEAGGVHVVTARRAGDHSRSLLNAATWCHEATVFGLRMGRWLSRGLRMSRRSHNG